MKKYFDISMLASLAVLSLVSCKKGKEGNECVSYTSAQVTKVDGPNSVSVNQEIDLSVYYYLSNGCGRFQTIETNTTGNTSIIDLKAKYEGCICTDILLSGQIIYKFKAQQVGVYFLKFLQPNKSYLIDTITVN